MMKTVYFLIVLLILGVSLNCNKQLNVIPINFHSAKVLAATCSAQLSSTEVAVQLDNKNPLSFDWTNPINDSVYRNVIVTFDPILAHAIGKSLTYTSVRRPNSKDTLSTATIAICISYPITYLDSITVK